ATFVRPMTFAPDVPRVLVGLAVHHHTWGLVDRSGALALHAVSADEVDLAWRLALSSGHDGDKLDGLELDPGEPPVLARPPAWLVGRVAGRLETGDRTVFLADVVRSGVRREARHLTKSALLAAATPAIRTRLDAQVAADMARDAAAVAAWRRG